MNEHFKFHPGALSLKALLGQIVEIRLIVALAPTACVGAFWLHKLRVPGGQPALLRSPFAFHGDSGA